MGKGIDFFDKKSYKVWFTLAVLIFLFSFKFLALVPFNNEGAIAVGAFLILNAQKNHIRRKPTNAELAYIVLLIVGVLFFVAYTFLKVIAGMSYLYMLILGIVLFAVQKFAGAVQLFLTTGGRVAQIPQLQSGTVGNYQIADALGAVLAFLATLVVFGSQGVYLAGMAAYLVLLPGEFPFIAVAFVALKLVVSIILA